MNHYITTLAVLHATSVKKIEDILSDYQWNFAERMLPPNNSNNIFVFGSNLSGFHGGGAALYASRHRGAEMGVGVGITGNCYALPTKDEKIETLPLAEIAKYVEDFLLLAKKQSDRTFHLTPVGCGLAGLNANDIAPMFENAPINVVMPGLFFEVILRNRI